MSKETTVNDLIIKWDSYRSGSPVPDRYCVLKTDLYNVRNSVPGTSYPSSLIDPDDEIMASVEHYFLTRCWVGSGAYPLWEIADLVALYDAGKLAGVTPRHNPDKPVTPVSLMQIMFQNRGMTDGSKDLKSFREEHAVAAKDAAEVLLKSH